MPCLMLAPVALLEELKQTDRQTELRLMYIRYVYFTRVYILQTYYKVYNLLAFYKSPTLLLIAFLNNFCRKKRLRNAF